MAPENKVRTAPSRLWVWFVAVALLQVAAWTAWFIIAAHHHVDSVPLAETPGK